MKKMKRILAWIAMVAVLLSSFAYAEEPVLVAEVHEHVETEQILTEEAAAEEAAAEPVEELIEEPTEEPAQEPAEEIPAEEPVEEPVEEEIPAEEPAAEEAPAEEEIPAEEPAAEEAPVEEVPAEEPMLMMAVAPAAACIDHVDGPVKADEHGHWVECAVCGEELFGDEHQFFCNGSSCMVCGFSIHDTDEDSMRIHHNDLDDGRCPDCGEHVGNEGHDWDWIEYPADDDYCGLFCEICERWLHLNEHYAVCKNPGRCDNCGTSLGDDWGYSHEFWYEEDDEEYENWVEIDGEMVRQCIYCGYVEGNDCHNDIWAAWDPATELFDSYVDPSNPGKHVLVCRECGEDFAVEEHRAFCGNPNFCIDCGAFNANGWNPEYYCGHEVDIVYNGNGAHSVTCKHCGTVFHEAEACYYHCDSPHKGVCYGCGNDTPNMDVWHAFPGEEADNNGDGACDRCGEDLGGECQHYNSCLKPGYCWYCDAELGEEWELLHDWWIRDEERDNWIDLGDGTHGVQCFDCGGVFEHGEHWQNCLNPGVCGTCGTALGDDYGMGHEWWNPEEERDNIIDNGDGTCSLKCYYCDYIEWTDGHGVDCDTGESGVCVRCGADLPEDHNVWHDSWIDEEQRENWVLSPEGILAKQCLRCGEYFEEHYCWVRCGSEGFCDQCGLPCDNEPQHDSWDRENERQVWVDFGNGWHAEACAVCGVTWNEGPHGVACDAEDKSVCSGCGVSVEGMEVDEWHNAWIEEEERDNWVPVDDGREHAMLCFTCGELFNQCMHSADCADGDMSTCVECFGSLEGLRPYDDFDVWHEFWIEEEERENWVVTEEGHARECLKCHERFDEGWHGISCDAEDKSVCSGCGTPVNANEAEEWHPIEDWTQVVNPNNPNEHGVYCPGCDQVVFCSEHWVRCDQPGVCAECGIALGDDYGIGHDWWNPEEECDNIIDNGDGTCSLKCYYCDYIEWTDGHGVNCDTGESSVCVRCGADLPEDHNVWHNSWIEEEERDNWVLTDEGWVIECLHCGFRWEQHDCWVRCGNEGVCDQCGNPCDKEPEHDSWNREEDRPNCFVKEDDPSMHIYVCDGCGEVVDEGPHGVGCWEDDKSVCSDCGASVEGFEYDQWHDCWNEEAQSDWVVNPENPDECGTWCKYCDYAEIYEHNKACWAEGHCDRCWIELPEEWEVGHNCWIEEEERDFQVQSEEHPELHYGICVDCGEVAYEEGHWANCADPNHCVGCGAEWEFHPDEMEHLYWDEEADDYRFAECDDPNQHAIQCVYCDNVLVESHWRPCSGEWTECYTCRVSLEEVEYEIWHSPELVESGECPDCGEYVEICEHVATCKDPDHCALCGEAIEDLFVQHNFTYEKATVLPQNPDYCGFKCTDCDVMADVMQHVILCDKEDKTVCSNCGTKAENMRVDHYGNPSTLEWDEDSHWYICRKCGERHEEQHVLHCDTMACMYDGEVFEDGIIIHVPGGVDWTAEPAVADYNENVHGWKCETCGRYALVEEHTFEDGICRCGKEEFEDDHEHRALCTNPTICVDCGEENPDGWENLVGHETWDAENQRFNCFYLGNGCHSVICLNCGMYLQEAEPCYTYCWEDDKNTCNSCGEHLEELEIWHAEWGKDPITDAEGHCANCGENLWEDECEHWVTCKDPDHCAECGEEVEDMFIQHDFNYDKALVLPQSPDYCGFKCRDCDRAWADVMLHITLCDQADKSVCFNCGTKAENMRADHYADPSTMGCDEDSHWYNCRKCGERMEEPHVLYCDTMECMYDGGVWEQGTILHVPHGVDWTAKPTAADYNKNVHGWLCSECNKYALVEEHTYENGVCTECGAACEHAETKWVAMDSETHAKECLACKEVVALSGEAHAYENSVCIVCAYACEHLNTKWVAVDGAMHAKECLACMEIVALSGEMHINENGFCTKCGAEVKGVTAVEFVPADITIAIKQPVTANAVITGFAEKVEYTTSNAKVATIDETGAITAKKAGSATITVTATGADGIAKTAELKVTVKKAPSKVSLNLKKASLGVGESGTLKATLSSGTYSPLTWTSSNESVATVSEAGVVTAAGEGTATITVETFNGKKASCTVTVLGAPAELTVDVTELKLNTKKSYTLKTSVKSASGGKCAGKLSFESSDPSVAAVDANGKITAKKVGEASITVSTYNGLVHTVTVGVFNAPKKVALDVTKANVNRGETLQLTAVIGEDEYTEFTWSTSAKKVATVNSDGLVTAVAEGSATITVKTANGKKATAKITVVDPYKPASVELSHSGTVTLPLGETLQLSASLNPETAQSELTWSSKTKKVATVDANGLVTPLKEGSTVITVKTYNGKTDTVTVKVIDPYKANAVVLEEEGTVTLGLDATLQLHAQLEPVTAVTELKWSSSSKKVATVDENGLVTPVKEGTATITVQTANGKKDTVKVKVVDPTKPAEVVLNVGSSMNIAVGEVVVLDAKVLPETAETTLKWTSSKPKVVAIEENAILGLKAGTSTITVQTANGVKDTVKVTVVAENASASKKYFVGDWKLDRMMYQDFSVPAGEFAGSTSLKITSSSFSFSFQGETDVIEDYIVADGFLIADESVVCRLYGRNMLLMVIMDPETEEAVGLVFSK